MTLTNLTRHPNVFKSAQGTSGTVSVWTPASGKKFRVLRYAIDVSGNGSLGTGGVMNMTLADGGVSVGIIHSTFVPTTAGTTGGTLYTTGWVDLGGIGILSSAANNVFGVILGSTLTAGNVRIRVAGIEE